MDYDKTLNLPRTSFPMKANLPEREPYFIKFWEENRIYHKMLQKRQKMYVLHDGPPYANGDIHLGQAYNKILKDIVIKSKALSGYSTPYIPGWDCHGLPVELQLMKKLGKRRKDEVEILSFRKRAREYALSFVKRQREEFKRLGILGEWDTPYLTMNYSYQAKIMEAFLILYEKGYIYRGEKPIYWCIECETALAEAEVEYEEKVSHSIWVKFKLENPEAYSLPSSSFILIWTTTPWTLPGNLAVALHPEEYYLWVNKGEEVWLVGEKTESRLEEEIGFKFGRVLKRLKGKDLEGIEYQHPLFPQKKGSIVLAEYVSMEEGSGCVHTAPGHGEEDFRTGEKYGLPPFSPVNEKGYFNEEAGEFAGLRVDEANSIIIQRLEKQCALVKKGKITHTYPHCWRCKSPVIFRATTQWFLGVDNHNLRAIALERVRKIRWIPPASENRIKGMIESRPDWCLSRQRLWGIPIPAFHCKNCGRVIVDRAILTPILEEVKEKGVDFWFEREEKDLLPSGFKCPKCGGGEFRKEKDILDVWMDSGVSHFAVLKEKGEKFWPADMYLEGSDQHRGWFQTSLLTSIGLFGESPYREVVTHGFVVDSEGKKMSKSLGNVVDPQDTVKKYGAEILRLWVASTDYSRDMRISEEILKGTIDAYRKIRNTSRFILGNLYDFSFSEDAQPKEAWWEIDMWAYNRLQKLIEKVLKFYRQYEFVRAFQELYQFAVNDLSSLYLDILKDRLYVFPSASPARRSAQTVLYVILRDYTKLIAPFLSFTAEEIWRHLQEKEESVFLSHFPSPEKVEEELEKKWEKFWKMRERVYQVLEEARKNKVIGSSLEAKVNITFTDEESEFVQSFLKDLPMLLIVSQVEVKRGSNWKVEVEKAGGKKCERCWMWSESVGKDSEHPNICSRCINFLRGDE
ncbi:isoleucine--tRNA ligase [Candidatus Calescamantes bacterium]|nr:isoleucine--tRNA ligase [Candidatus Calescamantes bacterium]